MARRRTHGARHAPDGARISRPTCAGVSISACFALLRWRRQPSRLPHRRDGATLRLVERCLCSKNKESTQSRGENGPCNPSSTPASYALTHSGDAISVALSRLSPAERHWSNLRRSVKSHRLCILSFLTVTFLHVRDPSMRSADRTRGGIAEICLSYEATATVCRMSASGRGAPLYGLFRSGPGRGGRPAAA